MNKIHENYLPQKKKSLGQHFLHKQSVVDAMIAAVKVDALTSVMEIGCGEGFLTQSILSQTACKQLLVYEIDPEWAHVVRTKIKDSRLNLKVTNILSFDWQELHNHTPLVLLANLPYQITFPIFFKLVEYKHLFNEGVVMIQEEVAQKINLKKGKALGATPLFLQRHFEFKLLEKIEPSAFNPPPKVYSRLVYFKPKTTSISIEQEEDFWKFVKLCFKSPRQTLKNNLQTTHFALHKLDAKTLMLRAQQLTLDDFLTLWQKLKV